MREHFQDVGVVAERERLVHASLQENLIGAPGLGLKRLLADFVQIKHIGFGAVGGAAETAKTTGNLANICVINNTKRRVTHLVSWVNAVAHGVACLNHFGPRGVFQNVECFRWGEAGSFNRFLQ